MSYLAGALAAALSRAAECELPSPVPDALGARRPRELAVLPRQLRSGRSESAGSSGDLVCSPEVGRVADFGVLVLTTVGVPGTSGSCLSVS